MLVLKLLSRLPLRVLYAFTDVLYVLVYRVWRFRKALTLENLRRSFPKKPEAEIARIAAVAYHNAFDMMAPYLSANRPIVLLASHHCNWEWLLLVSSLELKVSVDAVYKPLRVAGIDRFMFEKRS